ncbi:MAG: CAP domain-containing protein [Myxococcota bacterium]
MRTWAWVGIAAGCGADGDSVDPSATTSPATEDWPAEWAELEAEVLELVNQQRFLGAVCGDEVMGGGAPALEFDPTLRGVARAHSEDMADRKFFDHVNPDGDDPFDRMEAAGFAGALPWGENIAMGATSAQQVVNGWMNSPGHCVNILLPEYAVIGIGLFEDPEVPGGSWWTQNFAASH